MYATNGRRPPLGAALARLRLNKSLLTAPERGMGTEREHHRHRLAPPGAALYLRLGPPANHPVGA
jgi:hypothetical protein